ncbi:DENN domain-containing protein 1B isoform X1 [Bacillus rossius redtenbacheri]|uniref:DENN domain-containing protein 1B isoform X1 n=1 Tax=Bacillus rossius redtenbacheri TaxID=93214 RepID=UPI002FDCB3BB
MGSRIRENVKHLFQCFCEVVKPQPNVKDAWIIQKFPDSYKNEEVLKSVPKFAYPCDFENTTVQHYSFVLTNVDSKWTFGFCRHDPKSETALVILSYLPWHESFYKLLNQIAQITHGPKSDELWTFLEAVYCSNIPSPGGTLHVSFNEGRDNFVCACPNQYQLPCIPENRNLTEYYNAVDAHNMMVIFASMLYERRIIFTSKKLYRLSACVQSANAVIYPMNWQHIFIPVLPMALIDYLLAPMPYLIGVPEPVLKRARTSELGDVVVLDADTNVVETPFMDLESLPQDVVTSLRRQLRNRASLLGDGVSRAFLRALVQLIGGYRDALKFCQGERITFSADAFVESRPAPMQPFLRKMLELQIFQQFIEERLDMLNNGLGFSDEFELEACNYSGKSSSKLKQQYKEWTYTMKKEGSAFIKNVKSKANPAMKSAVKSVKERGKDVRSAYKELRSMFRDPQSHSALHADELERHHRREPGHKPRSAPSSPVQKRRPHTAYVAKPAAVASFRKEPRPQRNTSAGDVKSKQYLSLGPSSDPSSPEAEVVSGDGPGLQLSPLDMDLMGSLQEFMSGKCSLLDSGGSDSPPVDRTLKPVRSLESFKPSGGGCGSPDAWWTSPTAPLLLPPSPPHQAPPLDRVPHGSPSLNGCDVFGAAPFAMGGDGDLASPSSVDVVRLLPPMLRSPKQKQKTSRDLICLDSNPVDDFDPLLTKEKRVDQSSLPSVSQTLLAFQNHAKLGAEGLENPLYPYFSPTVKKMSPSRSANQGKGGVDGHAASPAPAPAPQRSFLHSSRGEAGAREADLLLREYGLDFNSFRKGDAAPARPGGSPQSNWTKFE